MKKLTIILSLIAWGALAFPQASTQTARYIGAGPTLPATCSPGPPTEVFSVVSGGVATPYYCSHANAWSPLGGGGGGGTVPQIYCDSSGTGNNYLCTGTPTIESIDYDGTWYSVTFDTANTVAGPTMTIDGLMGQTIVTVDGDTQAIGGVNSNVAYWAYFSNNSNPGLTISGAMAASSVYAPEYNNLSIGYGASLIGGTGAEGVTAFGQFAGVGNTGSNVDFFGGGSFGAGNTNSGTYVEAVGANTCNGNSGDNVVCIGQNTADSNTGSDVFAIGNGACNGNTANDTVCLGYQAAQSNSGKGYVNAIGYEAASGNTGQYVDAIGYQAAFNNTPNNVVAIGESAANGNAGGSVVAVGEYAAQGNTGSSVDAVGHDAASVNTGSYVEAFGFGSAALNSGPYVVAIGDQASYQNAAAYSVAIGYQAGYGTTNSGATDLVAIGDQAGEENSGQYVNAIGYFAAYNNSGDDIVAVGQSAALSNTGSDVNAIGNNTAEFNAGMSVVAIGNVVAANNIANYLIGIGSIADQGQTGGGNVTYIGDTATNGSRFIGGGLTMLDHSVMIGPDSVTQINNSTMPTPVGMVMFTGSGLNDATSGGTYTGIVTQTYCVEITVPGGGSGADEFAYDTNNCNSLGSNLTITGSEQTLDSGVTITFAATSGHTMGDLWTILATSNSLTNIVAILGTCTDSNQVCIGNTDTLETVLYNVSAGAGSPVLGFSTGPSLYVGKENESSIPTPFQSCAAPFVECVVYATGLNSGLDIEGLGNTGLQVSNDGQSPEGLVIDALSNDASNVFGVIVNVGSDMAAAANVEALSVGLTSQDGGTVVNAWGIQVGDMSAATGNHWAIQTLGTTDLIEFAGPLQLDSLAGTGNLPACLTASGQLYAGTTTTGILSCMSSDTSHSGILILNGQTSGTVALAVDDVAGTAIVYVMPSTNGSAGQVLEDNGTTTCPTLTSDAPSTCHQLIWAAGSGCSTTITTGTSATLSTCFTVNEEGTAGQAITYTLPAASSGAQYCADNGNNGSDANTGTLELLTSGSGQFLVFTDGTLSATGGYVISGGAARDGACVYGIDSTHWMFQPHAGTWAKH